MAPEGRNMRASFPAPWIVAIGLALAGCPADDDDDSGDDDTSVADDDSTGDDDTGYEWPGVYTLVRVCGAAGGAPSDPGPDIDAVLLRRDTGVVGYATEVHASEVPQTDNDHPTVDAALGKEDEVYVAVGPVGSWVDLSFGLDIEVGDLIVLFEVTDGSGEDETYLVLVSHDGVPGHWVKAETVTGAFSAGVGPPSYFMDGCEG
jgi:hypothetical protein